MEVLDVINEQDEVIGTATREECHSDPKLLHRTINFALVNSSKRQILITKRSLKKLTDPGKFCFMGEHLSSGENYEDALIRGVKEELGITVKKFIKLHKHVFKYPTTTELICLFLVNWDGEPIKYDPEEITGYEWVNITDLPKLKDNYSDMTRYWVETVDWKKV